MALKQAVDTLEGVPEALHSEYTKTEDGKFRLNVEGLSEMQVALKAANKEAADRRKALDALKGVDPEEYQRLKAEADDRAANDAVAKGQWDKREQQIMQKVAEKEMGWSAREKKLMAQIEHDRIESDALKHFLEAGADPKRVHQLLKLTRENLKLEEGEGGFEVRVVGPDGRPRIADTTGALMGLKHFAEEVKGNVPEFGMFFLGSGATGSGSHQSGGVNPAGTISRTDSKAFLANVDKIAKGDVKVGPN